MFWFDPSLVYQFNRGPLRRITAVHGSRAPDDAIRCTTQPPPKRGLISRTIARALVERLHATPADTGRLMRIDRPNAIADTVHEIIEGLG